MKFNSDLPILSDMPDFTSPRNIRQSNLLVESRQEFSLLEKKMMLLIVTQLDPGLNVQKDLFDDMYFKIPVSAFGEDYSFSTLKMAINKITTRNVTAYNEKKQWAKAITPIPLAELKNGMVTLMVQKAAMHLFQDLSQRGYSRLGLESALSLSSVYSQRLYELLSRWKDTGKWLNVEISHLKFLLGIDKKTSFNNKQGNGNLKNRVINPAMLELADKTDIEFDYEFIKEGREYKRINFYVRTKKLAGFIKNEQAKQDVVDVVQHLAHTSPGHQHITIISALAEYDFTPKQKNLILNSEKLASKFFEEHYKITEGVVKITKSKSGYMASHMRALNGNKF